VAAGAGHKAPPAVEHCRSPDGLLVPAGAVVVRSGNQLSERLTTLLLL
jgi:hypothetical protein